MTGKIRSSNLAEKKPTEWILDLFVDDLTSNAFDNLIATGNYPLPGARNPKMSGYIRMKSKLKKHQEYMDLDRLTVFPQLFDATNLSDVTLLPKTCGTFP